MPALADRRRSIKVGADIKKVAAWLLSGSHLAAARVERRFTTMPLAPFFAWRAGGASVGVVGALSRDEGRDAFLEDGARLYSWGLRDRLSRREYTVPAAGGFRAGAVIQPSDRGVPVRLRDVSTPGRSNTESAPRTPRWWRAVWMLIWTTRRPGTSARASRAGHAGGRRLHVLRVPHCDELCGNQPES